MENGLVTIVFAVFVTGLGLPCMPPNLSGLGFVGIDCPSWSHFPNISLWFRALLSLVSTQIWAAMAGFVSFIICVLLVYPGIILCGLLGRIERYVKSY